MADDIDGGTRNLNASKARLRAIGKQLYRKGIKEEYTHMETHIQAQIDDAGTSTEDQARLTTVKNTVGLARTDDAHLPTDIVNG